jgi:hypothetical protein
MTVVKPAWNNHSELKVRPPMAFSEAPARDIKKSPTMYILMENIIKLMVVK